MAIDKTNINNDTWMHSFALGELPSEVMESLYSNDLKYIQAEMNKICPELIDPMVIRPPDPPPVTDTKDLMSVISQLIMRGPK